MLTRQRQLEIHEILLQQKSVTVSELAERFSVSGETIRRDLKALELEVGIARTHGGAYLLGNVKTDLDVNVRRVLRTEEKRCIAQKTAQCISDGDTIFLDSSTTAWFIAKELHDRALCVVTNSAEIARILSDAAAIRLFVCGGEYSAETRSYIGQSTLEFLRTHYFDKAILSSHCVSLDYGLMDTDEAYACIRRTVAERSTHVLLAADHTKLGRNAFAAVLPLERIDTLISDREPPAQWKRFAQEHEITII